MTKKLPVNSDVKKLKQVISELKRMVRSLQKENKQLKREIQTIDNFVDVSEIKKERREEMRKKRVPICQQCGKGELNTKQFGIWVLASCDICGFRDRKKIEMKET